MSRRSALMHGKVLVAIAVASFLGGIFLGLMIIEPLAIAAGIGVLASWAVGIYVVAPRAGRIAKEYMCDMVAEPTEEDMAFLGNLTTHVMGNMGQLAQHEDAKHLLDPVIARGLDVLDERWQATLANKKSQYVKGAGQFALPEGFDEGAAMDMKAELVQVGDELLDSFGFEEGTAGRKLGQVAIMRALSRMGGNAGQGARGSTPDYIQQ
jgi:hypothetical protein